MLGTSLQKTRFYREVKAEGEVIGEERGQRSLLQAQLDRKFGKLPSRVKKIIAALDLDKLEALAIALLDFATISDLESWLKDFQSLSDV
jgi:predicted transposase YdaD